MELPRRANSALSSNQFRRLCRTDYLELFTRKCEWQDIHTQLRCGGKELGIPVNSEPAEYRNSRCVVNGLLSHIGMKDADKQEYTGARNARFSIFPVPVSIQNRRMDNGRSQNFGGDQPPVKAHRRPYGARMGGTGSPAPD